MKLDILLNVNPELFDAYMEVFDEYLIKASKNLHYKKEDLRVKFAESDSIIFNCSNFTNIFPKWSETKIGDNGYSRIPSSMEALFIGWYCNIKAKGSLKVRVEGINRHKIAINDVYNNKNPVHYFFTSTPVYVRENNKVDFIIDNQDSIDFTGEIYPLVFLISNDKRLYDGFLPIKTRISNSNTNSGNNDLFLSEIKKMLKPTSFEYVKIKNAENEEKMEIRPKLDPDYEEWLKTLKNGDVCQFCGTKITRIQKYCSYCGVALNNLIETIEKAKEGENEKNKLILLLEKKL